MGVAAEQQAAARAHGVPVFSINDLEEGKRRSQYEMHCIARKLVIR